MSDLLLRDSKGRWQQVNFQAFEMSCGPACVAMVERIYKHLQRSDEQRALQLSQKYPGQWTIDKGSYIYNLSSVLNAEGVKAYGATYVHYSGVRSYLAYYASFGTPCIAQVNWYGAGSHFIVAAIHDSDDTFEFFDPFYGIVEQKGPDFPYYRGNAGYFNGWLVITHQ